MDFTAGWGRPQWTWVVLAILSLVTYAAQHGKPQEPYNFPMRLIAFFISVGILVCGGFFS